RSIGMTTGGLFAHEQNIEVAVDGCSDCVRICADTGIGNKRIFLARLGYQIQGNGGRCRGIAAGYVGHGHEPCRNGICRDIA
ncbi:hypothetical protein, partial [Thiocapsa sp.]|uniref:hypothetical protein n=1 Tax=Thiocapsa sp. TaxID=2024551 RepID=UPI00359306F1